VHQLRDAALLRDGGAVDVLGVMSDDVVFMRQIATVALCIALVLSAVAVTGQSAPEMNVGLTLVQQYGYAVDRECRLSVRVFETGGRLQLRCVPSVPKPKPVVARRTLSDADVETVMNLARAADLYGGGYAGYDTRASDGVFETLTAFCCKRMDVVVLVTSDNPTFAAAGTRNELLQLLHRWKSELRKSAK
jgi:hypothetical protein